jgi:hypothetical protein
MRNRITGHGEFAMLTPKTAAGDFITYLKIALVGAPTRKGVVFAGVASRLDLIVQSGRSMGGLVEIVDGHFLQ